MSLLSFYFKDSKEQNKIKKESKAMPSKGNKNSAITNSTTRVTGSNSNDVAAANSTAGTAAAALKTHNDNASTEKD
jgi:hypothetical protein